MGHFAKVLYGKVVDVIMAEPEFFLTFVDSSPGEWIQTSYNTREGKHVLDGTPLRKNYAGIGYTYDRERDAFIPPQPYPSWILNEATCWWNSPVPHPTDNYSYLWDEQTKSWIKV